MVTPISSFWEDIPPGMTFPSVAALGTDHTYNGTTITGTAGEDLVFGDCVYRKTADGRWWKTDANFEAQTKPMIAMVCEDFTTGNSGVLLLIGFMRDDSAFAFTDGDPVFISLALGALTSTQPVASGEFVRKVGFGCGAAQHILWFCPDHTVIEVA